MAWWRMEGHTYPGVGGGGGGGGTGEIIMHKKEYKVTWTVGILHGRFYNEWFNSIYFC